MQYRKALLLTACLFFSALLCGQQYPFVHYTPKDGLVNSRVRKVYQDSKGRMYFITFGGLSVYDGARFRNYTMQNGLLADLVNDVLEVGEDSLLVAVNTCGLNVLVRGQMKQLNITKKGCPYLNQFLKSNDGNIYTTADDGLYKLNKNSFEKLPLLIPGQKDSAIYLGVIAEYKDFLVFTTNELRNYQGLYLYNKKTNKITDIFPEQFVFGLKTDHSGIVWASTGNGVENLDTVALAAGKLELRNPYATYINPESLVPGFINFSRQNELLTSSNSKGVTRYLKNGTLLNIASPEPSTTVSQNFFIDREDVLWIGHDGNGVYKLSNTNLQSNTSFSGENKSGIRTVRAVTPDSCWMVMNNRQWILQTTSKSKNYNITPSFDTRSLHADRTWLYATDYNNLYITTLPKQNEATLHFKKILTIPDPAFFGVYAVIDQDGNSILFESRSIYVIRNDHKIFTYPTRQDDLIEGMYVDKNNRLWVTSRFNGLMIFSLHSEDPARYIKKEFQFIKEFENASPRCMTVDQNELLWVGTRYNGLMGFELKNNQLKKLYHFQTHNGLTDNFITSLACDKNNNVIIGTQTGLDRLIKTRDGYRPENITKSNNIFAYINYVWTDAANNAFAWTKTGAVFQVEPVQLVKDLAEPQLLIEEMKVNGKLISPFTFPLRLKYFQRNINFSVAAPTFIDEKQVKYSYLLTGSGNEAWSDTTSVADINLLNLSQGNYSLKVKAFFPSTSYSTKEIEFSFSILPPWWQTWWFRVLLGLLIIGLLIIVLRYYYNRKLEKQKNILEKQQALEKERTRIAADMHDDLGAGLSTIRFLSEKVKRNTFSDVTKSDAEKIVTNSNDLVQKMNEIIWAMNEKNDTLEDLLFYTRSYAVEYCEENNLACETHLPETVPPVFVSGEIRRNVFLTVKESLHNIVKHANAEKVIIDFTINAALLITIKDDGKGFSENGKGSGNGLRNMQKRIESVNGAFEIVNTNGVMVKMKIPLPNSPLHFVERGRG